MARQEEAEQRRYWLWVTHPEYYLEDPPEDNSDRESLDPGDDPYAADAGGWWTCHPDTQQGDLALLYRVKGNGPLPESDIAYLIQAESDAYSLTDDQAAREQHWPWGCDYRPLRRFEQPLTYSQIRDDPHLEDWSAYRGGFQRQAWRISDGIWERLTLLLDERQPGYAHQVAQTERRRVTPVRRGEEQLEDALQADIALLRPFGFDLEVVDRQRVCEGHGGRIDLLCRRRHGRGWVVVEIKNVRAGRNTLAQIQEYMGWVRQRLAGAREPVEGLVVSRGRDVRFEAALTVARDVSQVDVEDVRLD